jgi:hypothetical protein
MYDGALERGTIPVPRTVKGRYLLRGPQSSIHEYVKVMDILQNPVPI